MEYPVAWRNIDYDVDEELHELVDKNAAEMTAAENKGKIITKTHVEQKSSVLRNKKPVRGILSSERKAVDAPAKHLANISYSNESFATRIEMASTRNVSLA